MPSTTKGLPYPANSDPVDVPGDLQSLAEAVDTELDGYVLVSVSTNPQTGTTYTLVLGDAGKVVEMNNAAANTLTVPPNSSVAFPVGTQITVLQTGAGQTTVAAGVGVTVNARPGLKIAGQWAAATLIKRATDTWVLVGALST